MSPAALPEPSATPEPSMRDANNPFRPQIPGWLQRVDQWFEGATDHFNPILVKEARQALKSRQFLGTFSLLLIAGWLWSLIGIAALGYQGYFVPGGRQMLIGYFWILTFPLIVVVPFAAYRSLAGEKEDGTYELLSITTLSPRQIITGKLWSSVLQIMVYLSALSPCIAFTYLLRGVDVLFLVFLIGYTSLISVLLCQLGLLLATQVINRQWQVIFSVLFILGLAIVFFFPSLVVSDVLIGRGEVFPYDDAEFWLGNGMMLSASLGLFLLMFLASTASITAWSENRSTPLRVATLIVHLGYIGWCGLGWALYGDNDFLIVYPIGAFIFWWIIGSMMIGERSQMSARVRRSLPHTIVGRMFIGWFYPGSAAGYLFTVANLFVIALVSTILAVIHQQASRRSLDLDDIIHFLIVATFTIIAYLGMARMFVRWMRRQFDGAIFGLVVNAVLVFAGTAIPFIIQMSMLGPLRGFTLIHFSNPFLTWYETLDGDMPMEGTILLGFVALVVFFLNLITAGVDISLTRAAAPQRIVEVEESQKPAPVQRRTNPWD